MLAVLVKEQDKIFSRVRPLLFSNDSIDFVSTYNSVPLCFFLIVYLEIVGVDFA